MNTIDKEYIADQQIDRIVKILRSVPEEAVPEEFDHRLRTALLSEMAHADLQPVSTPRAPGFFSSRRMRIGMSLAACFMVGILSISMYNSGMWDPPTPPGTELSGSAGAGISSEAETSSEEGITSEVGVLGDTQDGDVVLERTQPDDRVLEEKVDAIPPQPMQITSDPVSRHGGQFAELRDEQIMYSALAERYLNGQQYELDSYTWNLKTGEHRYSLRVWETGTEAVTERAIVLVGARGEIYEEQQPDEPIEPLRGD
jgi:hypothetical protein